MNADVYPASDGWRFRIKGDNGEIMAVGEAYVRRIDAEHALHALFRAGRNIAVTIRNHGNDVVNHYTLGEPEPQPEPEEPELPLEDERKCEHGYGIKQCPCPTCDAPKEPELPLEDTES